MTEQSLTVAMWAGGGVAGACFAGILTLLRSHAAVLREIVTLRIVLVGEQGNNGIKSEVGKLRRARHRHGNVLTNVLGRLHLLDGQSYQDAAVEDDE